MAISPDEIQLDAAQQHQVAGIVEEQQRPWGEVLQQALDALQTSTVSKPEQLQRRQAGHGKGKISMAPDFDAPLEEFEGNE